MLLRRFSDLGSSQRDRNKISFYLFACCTAFQRWNFVLVRNMKLAPRNEFASSNFVGSPYSHILLAILNGVHKAHTIPFHWLFDGRQRRPTQHCFYSKDTSKSDFQEFMHCLECKVTKTKSSYNNNNRCKTRTSVACVAVVVMANFKVVCVVWKT